MLGIEKVKSENREIYYGWLAMTKAHNSIERKVLELLRHPDATQEQVYEAVQYYRSSYNRMCRAEDLLFKKYGANLKCGPWYLPRFRQTQSTSSRDRASENT